MKLSRVLVPSVFFLLRLHVREGGREGGREGERERGRELVRKRGREGQKTREMKEGALVNQGRKKDT